MAVSGRAFVARQPILDRRSRMFGHEILHRSVDGDPVASLRDPEQDAARVLFARLESLDLHSLVGGGLAFLPVDAKILHSERVESLPPRRVVLELLESVKPGEALEKRCRQLRRRGFSLALKGYVHGDARAGLLNLVQYVKLDPRAMSLLELRRLTARLRGRRKLLAESVDCAEDFEACSELGFELFQGYFFARASTSAGEALNPARSAVMELLRKVAGQAGIDELSAVFGRNVNLGITLLRLVNSVEFARRQRIDSVEQALVLLGERRLRSWLSLLLFAGDEASGVGQPLLQLAALRARLLELLARATGPPLAGSEGESQAFLTGMLSLADVVLGVSPAALVESLCLEPELAAALLERRGKLGGLLELAEALERADFPALEEGLEALGLDAKQLAAAQFAAVRWAAGLEDAARDEED